MENLSDFSWITWVFSGIGTSILGFTIYKVTKKQRISQKQTAGKNSKQYQSMNFDSQDVKNNKILDTTLNQSQKAGDNSEQIQIGGNRNDE